MSTSRASKKRRRQARGGGSGKVARAATGSAGHERGKRVDAPASGDARSAGKAAGAATGATGAARAAERSAGARSRAGSTRSNRVPRFEVRDGVSRPDAVWAPFPLTELGMAAGLVIFVAGFVTGGSRGGWLLAVGALVLVVVTGELSLREHFAGFRSHTMLLAVLPVVVLHATIALAISSDWGGPLALGIDIALAAGLARLLHGRFRAAHERAIEAS